MDPKRLEIPAGTEVVLIAGPTASGKSRLALEIAARHGGEVINADSMQVYDELRILTARPEPDDERRLSHRLYGHVPASERYSVGRWLLDIAPVIAGMRAERRLAVVVGGTGLYFKALTEGLASVPPIPAALRQGLLERSAGETSEALHQELSMMNPEDAAQIRPSDRSRILRALEVFESTGRSLERWRGEIPAPLLSAVNAVRVVMDPDRALLHRRIAQRAEAMMTEGAIAEVSRLLDLDLSPDLPAMKAIGVREITSHLQGKLSLDETLAAIRTETRRYAKRQMTWFRHQTPDWPRLGGAEQS